MPKSSIATLMPIVRSSSSTASGPWPPGIGAALGDLELERLRRHAGLGQQPGDQAGQVAVHEASAGRR